MKKDNNQGLLRDDVPVESTWNRETLFNSWDDWQAEYDLALDEFTLIAAFKNRLNENPAVLVEWFKEYGKQRDRILTLLDYAFMAAFVNTKDTQAKACQGQILSLWAKLDAALAYAEAELTAIGENLLLWAANNPELQIYTHYFEDLLRIAPYRRSEEVEEILGMLQDPFFQVTITARELTNTDLKFADATDSQGNQHPVYQATLPPTGIHSPDREHRRTAWESFCDGHLTMQNTLASNFLSRVKQMITIAKIRGHDSVLEMMLAPSNLPTPVFHNVINTFKSQLPVWHRYWTVRKKVLNVETLHPYDVWAPVVKKEPNIPFAQAVGWICEALVPLGKPYTNIIRKGCLEDRWVDYAPNIEKEQGAAAFLPASQMPAFIYIGYENTVTSMSILAHELGHSLHFHHFANSQPQVYREFSKLSSAIAETASNFHQAMLRAYLLDTMKDNRNFKLALIDEALYNFHRYFFIMPTLARFEWEVYRRAEQNQPLTAPILNQIMVELFAEGYGHSLIDDPSRTQITWAQFSHLYNPFYTIQYSVGIAAAHAIAENVRSGSFEAADRYLQFLSAGSSLYPAAAFELAGVDMSTPAPVEKAFNHLSFLVDQFEELAA